MADRLPEHILRHLREALQSAQMERASFGPDGDVTLTHKSTDTPVTYGSITDFIKEATALYRNSWIIGPIEEVLKWSSSKDDGSASEYDLVRQLRMPLMNPALREDAAREIERLRRENAILRGLHQEVMSLSAVVANDLTSIQV